MELTTKATVFVSYSFDEHKMVIPYIQGLESRGYKVMTAESLLEYGRNRKAFNDARRQADGTIVFLTPRSADSPDLNTEIGMAQSLTAEKADPKFLIPVTFDNAPLPGIIRELFELKADKLPVDLVLEKIEETIRDFMQRKKNEPVPPRPTKEKATQLQTWLKRLGYFKGVSDGIWGPATENSLRQFQQALSLAQTGLPDQRTEDALNSEIKKLEEEEKKKRGAKEKKYWILKLKVEDNFFRQEKISTEEYFANMPDKQIKGPEKNRTYKIEEGDEGYAIDGPSLKILYKFRIRLIEKLPDDRTEKIPRQSINMSVGDYYKGGIEIPESEFGFIYSKSFKEFQPGVFYNLNASEFDKLGLYINRNRPSQITERVFNTPSLSAVFSDSTSAAIRDELGFEGDVNALASVIAYTEVKPPLAIGLFGNWGSGKSFFMSKLRKRIDDLSADRSEMFCKKVLQIEFNSWHYSDSNLWASLITKIFEDLEKFGNRNNDELNELFSNLNSAKELLQETENEKERVVKEINLLTGQKQILENKVQEQSNSLKALSMQEILTGLMKNTLVQQDFDKLNQEYSFVNLKEYDDIKKNLEKLDDFSGKISASAKMAFSFMKGGKLLLALLFISLVAMGLSALVLQAGWLKQFAADYKAILSIVAGSLGLLLKFLQPAVKTVNNAFSRLRSLNETVDGLRQKARDKFIEQRESLDKKLDEAQSASEEVQKKIDLFRAEQKKLQNEIDDITSGKKIIRFIEGRVTDVRYINSLGIISWVRKDFEQLDSLLRQQKNAQQKAVPAAAKKAFELERIILYIDDLDRCNEAIVVRVLEAIHLLLAFPIFVVVVGVDPRWMHRALNVHYSKLLTAATAGENKHPDPLQQTGHPATSYDYLEKIFQIPFALKPIDNTGKVKLIKAQFTGEQQVRSEKIEKKPLPPDPLPPAPQPPVIPDDNQKQNPSQEIVPNIPATPNPDTPPPGNVKIETLLVSAEEISFIEELAFLIGESPRTIKRYTNIYRIIRTHSTFEIDRDSHHNYYFAAIILLAVITGLPDQALNFFEKINTKDNLGRFTDFLSGYIAVEKGDKKLLMLLNEKLNSAGSLLNQKASNLLIDHFKRNISLVSRFSFRNIT